MTRELHHPRAESADLEAATVLLVRRVYGEAVRMLSHTHPIAVDLWQAIARAEARKGDE